MLVRPPAKSLQNSLVLVHGGMAQDVGPILEMVTERYLLRSEGEWDARQEAHGIFDRVAASSESRRSPTVGACTDANYEGPIQTIIPWAGNFFTDTLIDRTRETFGDRFRGFWMLGGMAGGGMGFMFDPEAGAKRRLAGRTMLACKRQLESQFRSRMDPVVYDFAINERGTWAELLPAKESTSPEPTTACVVPQLVRAGTPAIARRPASRTADRWARHREPTRRWRPLPSLLIDHLLPRESFGADQNSLGLGRTPREIRIRSSPARGHTRRT